MKCTGRNCPMQIGTVDPAHCLADECPYVTKPLTNADRIRAMTDEELADVFDHVQGDAFLVGIGQRKNSLYPGAGISWLDWLKQEVDDG